MFNSLEEAILTLKLDRRRKYSLYGNQLVYSTWATMPCTGCSCECSDGYGCNHGNSGCEDCGYTKKEELGFLGQYLTMELLLKLN